VSGCKAVRKGKPAFFYQNGKEKKRGMHIDVNWKQGFQFRAVCRGHEIITDQPEKDGGTDKFMTPGELFVASLGNCIGVFALKFCLRHNLPIEGMKLVMDCTKLENPARVGSVKIDLHYPHDISETLRKGLLRMAQACFVHESIVYKPEIVIELKP